MRRGRSPARWRRPARCRRRRRTPRTTAVPAAARNPRNSSSPTIPVSLRNCSGRLCGSVTTMSFVRRSRCVNSKVPAPVPRAGWSSNACQASFHQSQRLDELTVARRCGPSCALALVGCAVNSLNHPVGFVSTTTPTAATATPTTRTPSATCPTSRRRRSSRGRRSSASEPRYATAPTNNAASTNTTANQAPSCTRTEWLCPSSARPGCENAQTATPRPAPPPSRSAAALSTRGLPSAIQRRAATPPASTPPRE